MNNELKTWGDLARRYPLTLFNKVIELEDNIVLQEYHESLEYNPTEDEKEEFEQLRKDDPDFASQYGEDEIGDWLADNPSEVYQWYIINANEYDVEYLNKEFNLNIFYSDFLDLYILPVYHFGTGWDILNLKGGYATEDNK